MERGEASLRGPPVFPTVLLGSLVSQEESRLRVWGLGVQGLGRALGFRVLGFMCYLATRACREGGSAHGPTDTPARRTFARASFGLIRNRY